MPEGIYNVKCTNEKKTTFTPTKHQLETQQAFLNSKLKGMLLYHKLGSGKTCTSIMIADTMLKERKVDRIFLLTPGSLRSGWVQEYCYLCGDDRKTLEDKYTFITYNYKVGYNVPDFNKSLVIIDEVHNLINSVKNGSEHGVLIYDKIANANCRVLALSGTPIYNYVYEFAILGNLLNPGAFPDIRKKGSEIDTYIFMNLFNINSDGALTPKNETSLKRKLEGIISYYPGAGEEYVPEVIEVDPIKIQMTPKQEIHYWEQKIIEDKLSKPPRPGLRNEKPAIYKQLQKLYAMAKKNVLSRKASNFFYPDEFKGSLDILEPNKKNAQKVGDKPVKEGWVNKKLFADGQLTKIYSTKFVAFLTNLVAHIHQKHVLFTFFKNKSGVQLIKTILNMCGISSEIFSGDLDDSQRKSLLRRFNSEENKYGDIIRILLVTEAGAEGISILDARHMHILESSNRINKTVQAIGRVARFKSHMRLPPEERKIKVWRYWSVASPDEITIQKEIINREGEKEKINQTITNKKTIDEILYENGMKNIRSINSFLKLLENHSVTKSHLEK